MAQASQTKGKCNNSIKKYNLNFKRVFLEIMFFKLGGNITFKLINELT